MRFTAFAQLITLLAIGAMAAPTTNSHSLVEPHSDPVSSEQHIHKPIWTKGSPKFQCTGCDREFWTSSRLLQHLHATEHGPIPGADSHDLKQYQIDYQHPNSEAHS